MEGENSQVEALLGNANIEHMLEFETQIFLDIVRSDGLIIAAKYVILYQSYLSYIYFF